MDLFTRTLNAAITTLQSLRGTAVSDRELAKEYGITTSNLSRWRNGRSENLGAETLLRILRDIPSEEAARILLRPAVNTTQVEIQPPEGAIQIAGEIFSLRDLHHGLGILGGIGTGADYVGQSFLRELLVLCTEDSGPTAKLGGIILAPRGGYLQTIVAAFQKTGRPLSDLIILGQGYPHKYNPIDPDELPEDTATKLWDGYRTRDGQEILEKTREITYLILRLLKLDYGRREITLTDLSTHLGIGKATELCARVETKVAENDDASLITPELGALARETIAKVRADWINLDNETQAKIEHHTNYRFAPLRIDPTLKEIFTGPNTFSFREVINDGKIIVFMPERSTHQETERLIARCLLTDMQKWAKRRCGSAASAWELDTERTIMVVANEFERIGSLKSQRDTGFGRGCRTSRTIQILTAPSISGLEQAGTECEVRNFRQNIGTWIILKTTDAATEDLAKRWQEATPNHDRKKFTADFLTVTPEKSKDGPWFTEGMLLRTTDELNPIPGTTQGPTLIFNPKSRILKFDISPEDEAKTNGSDTATELLLATLESKAFEDEEIKTLRLSDEEAVLTQCIEKARRRIVGGFPELGGAPAEEPPKYRMIPTPEKTPPGKMFTPDKTLRWATKSKGDTIHGEFRKEIVDSGLPEDLKSYLLRQNPQELRGVFQRILTIA